MPGDALARRAAVVEAPVPRALLALAWPAVLASSLESLFGLIDAVIVGRGLGAAPLAALSTAAFVLWALDAFAMAVSIGLGAIVARRVGESDAEGARRAVAQGLLLAGFASVVVGGAGLLTARLPFAAMGVAADVAADGAAYLRVLFLGVLTLFVLRAAEAALRGAGDTRLPLLLLGGSCVLKIALSPLLVFGAGPIPALGVPGAAAATVLAQGAAGVVGVALLARRGLLVVRAGADLAPRWRAFRECLRIGLPTSLHGVLFCGVYLAVARVTGEFGTPALAALGVGNKGEAPCYFLGVGLSAAVASIVGQSLGAGLPDRAERVAWLAVRAGGALALAWTAVLVAAPGQVAAAFTANADVAALARSYFVIVGLSQAFMLVELVLDGAFAGAGNTLPALVVGVPLALARIPLAWLLASQFGLGPAGVWWTISLTGIAKGVLLWAWFRRGHWKSSRIAAIG